MDHFNPTWQSVVGLKQCAVLRTEARVTIRDHWHNALVHGSGKLSRQDI
jgi:hypothetical protein